MDKHSDHTSKDIGLSDLEASVSDRASDDSVPPSPSRLSPLLETKNNTNHSPKRLKMAPQDPVDIANTNTVNTNQLTWPAAKIPVEIFELVTSLLGRSETRTLRLVCREFDHKVSARYFRNVVVPFRSELYGALTSEHSGTRQHPSSALLSNGMRIFESFGPHILRFALSLEIDEHALAHPPIKPTQELVSCFWGIYRWPHATYSRYSDLESIEQTADETQSLKEALRYLTKVINLGICCDAGLGFLIYPDEVARAATDQVPVFSTGGWKRERPQALDDESDGPRVTLADSDDPARPRTTSFSEPSTFKRMILERMAFEAGYRREHFPEAIQILLDTEATDIDGIALDDQPGSIAGRAERRAGEDNYQEALMESLDGFNVHPRPNTNSRSSSTSAPASNTSLPNLQPTRLTQAQKELLLELEWVHRAMIQSYVIAMIDIASNGPSTSLANLTTLTIAKIPSSHVHLLCREDLWDSLPGLSHVSLGVIADWRKISKTAPGWVEDTPVSPSGAVSKVFKLLHCFIGQRSNIENLRFEWICGGEFAASFFQRNQYVLPAPFVDAPHDMAALDAADSNDRPLLRLPHIKELSLKNCWISPHVLVQTIREMALASLESLELESVSLSAPPTRQIQFPLHHPVAPSAGFPWAPDLPPMPPPAVIQGNAAGEVVATGAVNGDHANPSPSDPANDDLPKWFTWAGILEQFSPSVKVRNISVIEADDDNIMRRNWREHVLATAGEFLPDVERLLENECLYKLKYLAIRSCGYVAIDMSTLNTRSIFPPGIGAIGSPAMNDVQASIKKFMQRSTDRILGRIVPYISPTEEAILSKAFGMRTGWFMEYQANVIRDAIADGVECPGMGRISGVLSHQHQHQL